MLWSFAFDPATLPAPLLAFFVSVTHLGNPVFVVAVTIGLYWLDPSRLPRFAIDRRHTVALLGVLLCSAAVVEGGKTVIDVSRPEAAGTAATVLDIPHAVAGLSGESLSREANSFPSGHTVAATVLWGGLAVLAEGRRDHRAIAAGTVVALVAGSRYVLGVHYLTDLVGGLVVGLAVLCVLWLLVVRENAAGPALGLATVCGGGLVGLFGAGTETVAIAGIAVGATAAWRVVEATPGTAAAGPRPAVLALAGILPLWAVTEVTSSLLVAFVVVTAATAWAMAAPVVAGPADRDGNR